MNTEKVYVHAVELSEQEKIEHEAELNRTSNAINEVFENVLNNTAENTAFKTSQANYKNE
ncbi:MAG: hypothetical protein Q4G11_05605 [Gallicola sp.]|nr:hypothetical protein [Gallicola sp.]